MGGACLQIVRVAASSWVFLLFVTPSAGSDDPKPTPENTISIQLREPVKPQQFSRPTQFYIEKVIDRSGNPQPLLVYKGRGGVFLDRLPAEIVRQALQESLERAGVAAPNRAAADFVLNVYVFHFGQAPGSGAEYYGKVELTVAVKSATTGKSLEISALGTSIEGIAVRKKTLMKNVQENIEQALEAALRNFLCGTKLRDAVTLEKLDRPNGLGAAPADLMSWVRDQPPPGHLAPRGGASSAWRSRERETAPSFWRPTWPGTWL
jgi:hypothetical protein